MYLEQVSFVEVSIVTILIYLPIKVNKLGGAKRARRVIELRAKIEGLLGTFIFLIIWLWCF